MHLINSTHLVATPLFLTDRNGADTLVMVIKGTWRINQDGSLSLADDQVPISHAPIYHGDPAASSLIHDTDAVLYKPGTDCILLGHAWAPKGRVRSLDVSFVVGPVRRTARVFGERVWMKLLWNSMSRPVPFESIPLLWERSFGGEDKTWPDPDAHEACLENPVGRGFLARKTKRTISGMRLPNIEDPSCLIKTPKDRPVPVGFTPMPPHWRPRARYAGTCDNGWKMKVSPFPPKDQDPRFHCAAAPGLTAPRPLIGNETVLVENGSRRGRLRFALPGIKPGATVRVGRAERELSLSLDTVVVEPDEDRLVLTWRGACTVHGQVHEIGRMTVGVSQL